MRLLQVSVAAVVALMGFAGQGSALADGDAQPTMGLARPLVAREHGLCGPARKLFATDL